MSSLSAGIGKTMRPDTGFVACIEGGVLETQALLLFESIRLHTGRFKNSALYALSPRSGHPISANSRRRLDDLGVQYIDKLLNTECPEYGSANRVAAAAYIEETYRHDLLVILDSDTLFLREPTEFILPADVDVAVRPVDNKGISTGGSKDQFDKYWLDLCNCCGVDYDAIPWGESFIDEYRIKANYNGGLVVARGELGIMRRWADFFFASIRQGLRPHSVTGTFRTGAGWAEPAAGALWGSNQAALTLAIWSTTRRVRTLPPTYNYPLHQHAKIDPALVRDMFQKLVHVHYHWLFAEDALPTNPLFLQSGPLSAGQHDWLRPASAKGKRSVCILGMHRSGTSLTARIVNLLGVDLGSQDELSPVSKDNITGFWEHKEIVQINERILACMGGCWDIPPDLAPGWEYDPGLDALRHHAQSILEKFDGVDLWGWKDPRTCLTLPFWNTLITRPVSYIICLRSPVEVAASLAKRDKFSFEKSIELWVAYTLSAIKFTSSRPRHFMFYEDLMGDGLNSLRSLAGFLEKSDLAEEAKVKESVLRFIKSDLQHHQTKVIATMADPRLQFPAKALYAALRLALPGSGWKHEDNQEMINLFSQSFTDFQQAFDGSQSPSRKRRKQTCNSKQAVQSLTAQVYLREAQIEELYQSSSWRLTRPLRAVGAALRALREHSTRRWLTKDRRAKISPAKVICIHHRLAGLTSHHFNESSGLIHEFKRRGCKFLLLINRQASRQITAALHARAVLDDPTFNMEWSFEERTRRFLEMLHAKIDKDLNADDRVMVTISTQLEAHALTLWLQELPLVKKPWIVILFLSDRWNRAGREEYDRQIAEFRILKAAIARLTPENANRLIILTLTNKLAEELGDLLGAKVAVTTMPLEYGDPVLYSSSRPNPHLSRVAVLGGMRREKGSYLVPDIIRAVRQYAPVEFLVHLANNTLTADDLGKMEQVALEPNVTVIREPMSLPEYNIALNSADIALFPYEIIPYRKRTSGVFAEAVAYGKPVVTTRGTWMAEQIESGLAAGTISEDLQPKSIARAVALCVADLKQLQQTARTLSTEWRKKTDISAFVDFMEEEIARRSG